MTTNSDWLQIALNKPHNLTIQEFMHATEFKIDEWAFDKFFINVKDDQLIYMAEDIIRWFGYSGALKLQKRHILDMLKTNFENYKDKAWFEYSNAEYNNYYENKKTINFPTPDNFTSKGKSTTKHLLVYPHLFEHLVLMVNTKNSFRIRSHYIDLKNLAYKYLEYSHAFEKKNFQEEIKKLSNLKHNKEYTRLMSIITLESELSTKYKLGCVYFIQEEYTKNIKIGWCYHLPHRLSELQLANSQALTVLKSIITTFAYEMEQHYHSLYKDYHIRGEWFSSEISEY